MGLSSKKPRVTSIDFIRIFVISMVILSHIVATGSFYGSEASGAVWMISHVSRNLFLIITAFVLFYQYNDIKLTKSNIWKFYKRRFPLILVPYILWTLIYQVQGGVAQNSLADFLSVFFNNLITSQAWYHLYFLLLTMQIYLLFPIFVWTINKLRGHIKPVVVFCSSLALQLLITACMHYNLFGNVFGWWFNSPDTNLLSYQLYVVAGLLMAEHWEKVKSFLLGARIGIYLTLLSVVVFGLIDYFVAVAGGEDVVWASAVFQPLLVLESVLFMATFTVMGLRWVQKGSRGQKAVKLIGEDSFGIYLSHALILTKLSLLQSSSSEWYAVLAGMLIGLPVVYGGGFLLSEFLRRTPFSVILTGRKSIFKTTRLYAFLECKKNTPVTK